VIVRKIAEAGFGADAMTSSDCSIRTIHRMVRSIEAGEAVSLARPSHLRELSGEVDARFGERERVETKT